MNIKKMSSRVLALVLAVLMLATAVYTGVSTLVEVKAAAEYQRLLDCYVAGARPTLKYADRWNLNILDIGDTTDPLNPSINSTIIVHGTDADNKTISAYYQQNKKGFTTQKLYAAHRTNNTLPFYSFDSGAAGYDVKFHMVDDGTYTYGAQYLFKINQTHAYDLQANLRLVSENDVAGTIYYRAVAIAEDGTKTVVWPDTGSWHSEQFSTATGIMGDIDPVEFNFPVGTRIGIECYADLTSGTDLTVAFGSPAIVTIGDKVETSKGTATQYKLLDYSYYHLYGSTTAISNGNFYPNKSRFNFYYINTVSDANHNALQCYPFKQYNPTWTLWQATIVDKTGANRYVGYHMASADALHAETRKGGGVAYDFTMPTSGSVSMELQATVTIEGYIRVLRNGEVVHPSNGGWDYYTKSGTISAATTAEKGDVITVQMYSEADTAGLQVKDTVFTVYDSVVKNSASGNFFAAALEAPYPGKNYTGEFVADDTSIWSFKLLDNKSGSNIDVNYFDATKDNFLYYNEADDVGFKFMGNDLHALVVPSNGPSAAEGTGVTLAFNVPVDGVYDISTAANIVKGNGNVNYRVSLNTKTVFPTAGDWYAIGKDYPIVPVEVSAKAGDIIIIDYTVTDSSSSVVELNLGTVNIYKEPENVPSSVGFWNSYAPFSYAPYTVDKFDGNITYQATRYDFNSFVQTTNKSAAMTKYNSNTKLLSSADGNVVMNFNSANLETTAKAGNGAELLFTVPTSGEGKVALTPAGANAKYRVLYDGAVVIDWTDADNTLVEKLINVEAGKKIAFQMYNTADGTLSFGVPSVSYEGDFRQGATADDQLFYPISCNPYSHSDYVGDYNQKVGIWMFDTMSVNKADGSITFAPTNYYDSKRLYNKENGVGYTFDATSIYVDFTSDSVADNGMHLEFISPKDEEQGFDMSAIIIGSKAATAHFRITKNGEKIWPVETDWHVQDMVEGSIIDFPFYEFICNQGDKIAMDLYFTGLADGDTMKIDLGSPYVKTTAMSYYFAPDVEAKVYAAKLYNPYLDNPYAGTANLVESRWNFEFIDLIYGKDGAADTLTATYKPNTYNYGWNKYLYYVQGQLYSGYHVDSTANDLSVELYNETDSAHGISLRYVSPLSGSVKITGCPGIQASALVNGAEFMFRILVNDTVIFPTTGDWAVGDASNGGYLGFTGVDANLEVGDQVIYQYILKTPNLEARGKVAQFGIGNPSIVVVTDINMNKTKFSHPGDFTPNFQLSPYWSYVYALDNTNPEFLEMPRYYAEWGLWMHASEWLACGKNYMWFMDNGIYNSTGKHGVVATQLTVPKTGYIAINAGKVQCQNMDKGYARITVNGENVWPEGQGMWNEIVDGSIDYEAIYLAINEGDIVRFEGTMGNDEIGDWSDYIWWSPSVTWSKNNLEYADAKNIYSGLDEAAIKYFQELAKKLTGVEFDEDFEANKNLAENMPEEDEEFKEESSDYVEDFDDTSSDEEINEDEQVSSSEDTSSKNTSSKKKGQVVTITYIEGGIPVWVIILICVGGAVLLAGIIVVVILVVNKNKKNAATAAAAAAEAAVEGETAEETAPEADDASAE